MSAADEAGVDVLVFACDPGSKASATSTTCDMENSDGLIMSRVDFAKLGEVG